MYRPRIIPLLQYNGKALIKTAGFKNPKYIGDPINTIRIFNEKGADELIFLDLYAARENRKLDLKILEQLSEECCMPFSAGGGIVRLEDFKNVIRAGAEKAVINHGALQYPELISRAADSFGSQSVIVSIDVKKNMLGNYCVYSYMKGKTTSLEPVEYACRMEELGAGEIFLNSVDRDGSWAGYDCELIRKVSAALKIPVIACGGAGSLSDMADAISAGASAVSAGSYFIFRQTWKAVMINFPTVDEIKHFCSLLK